VTAVGWIILKNRAELAHCFVLISISQLKSFIAVGFVMRVCWMSWVLLLCWLWELIFIGVFGCWLLLCNFIHGTGRVTSRFCLGTRWFVGQLFLMALGINEKQNK